MSHLRLFLAIAGLLLAAGASAASGHEHAPAACPDGSEPVQEGDTWYCPVSDPGQSDYQNMTGPDHGNATHEPPTCEEGTFGPEWDAEGGYWYCYTEGAGPDHNTWEDPNSPPECPDGHLGPEWDAEGGYWYCYTEGHGGNHSDGNHTEGNGTDMGGNWSHGEHGTPPSGDGNHTASAEEPPVLGGAPGDGAGSPHGNHSSTAGSGNNSTGNNSTANTSGTSKGRTPAPGLLLVVAGLGAVAFALRRK